jgi:hypothetical protein
MQRGSRVIIVVSCCNIGRSSENICWQQWRRFRKKERQDETQFTTKIGRKRLSLGYKPYDVPLVDASIKS